MTSSWGRGRQIRQCAFLTCVCARVCEWVLNLTMYTLYVYPPHPPVAYMLGHYKARREAALCLRGGDRTKAVCHYTQGLWRGVLRHELAGEVGLVLGFVMLTPCQPVTLVFVFSEVVGAGCTCFVAVCTCFLISAVVAGGVPFVALLLLLLPPTHAAPAWRCQPGLADS